MYSIKNITALTFLIAIFLVPLFANAITLKRAPKASFGGRVVLPQISGITCVGQYWLATIPAGGFPTPGPLVITATKKTITAGSSIIGLVNYQPSMSTCFIPGPVPIYIPSWEIDTAHFNVTANKR